MNITEKINNYLDEKVYKWEEMRDWVFDKLENTEMDIDELRDAFNKKFGEKYKKYLEKAMDEYMD